MANDKKSMLKKGFYLMKKKYLAILVAVVGVMGAAIGGTMSYMTETEEGKELVQNIQKDSGVKEISPEEIIDAYNNESSQIPDELEAVLQKMEAEYSNILYYLDILQRPLELAENNSLNPESCNMKEKGKN